MANRDRFPRPKGWTKIIRSSVLHAVSLASAALTTAWGRAARSRRPGVRIAADVERAETEIALLKEELSIKDARWSRVPPRRRPYYSPIQRMRILQLKAARGWSSSQTAEVLLITEETIASWLRRIDEEGKRGLVEIAEPVNKFPDLVGYLVRWLKVVCPTMGKVRIAQVLARAGLHLAATTVGRMLRDSGPEDEAAEVGLAEDEDRVPPRTVKAGYPDHRPHLARRSLGHPHDRRVLDTVFAVLETTSLALLLVDSRGYRSVLAPRERVRAVHEDAIVSRGLRVP